MKRFTETGKWDKPWFHDLEPALKCLWNYICDNCDAAGVWEPNWKLASFTIGKKLTAADLAAFGERVVLLECGKIWLSSFIEFQYGKLSKDCRPHLKIFESLNKHGIEFAEGQELVVRARVGHVSAGKRKAIYDRDGHACVYCGSTEALEPDHILSRKNGGSDAINNLVTACHKCNSLKADRSATDFLSSHPQKDRVLKYLDTLSSKLAYPTIGRDKEEEEDKEEDKDKETEGGKGMPLPKIDTEAAAFSQFWEAYPRKEGKGEAEKSWRAKKCTPLLPEILAAIDRYKRSAQWQRDGGQFIPHPGTWLNQKRWGDDPTGPPAPKTHAIAPSAGPKGWNPMTQPMPA